MTGWIKLHRQIREHRFWSQPRRFSNAEAWIDLLLSASHKDHEVSMGTEVFTVKRGQVLTSQVKLAKRWRWNRETVNRFLKQSLNMHEISSIQTSKETSTGYTLITIENYDKYQSEISDEPALESPSDPSSNPASSIHPAYTIKNEKNEKKYIRGANFSQNGRNGSYQSVPALKDKYAKYR
jgi:DNA replication protein DnaD